MQGWSTIGDRQQPKQHGEQKATLSEKKNHDRSLDWTIGKCKPAIGNAIK